MAAEHFFDWLVRSYARRLRTVLRHQFLTLMSLLATIALTGTLFATIPKGFFPQQDNGFLAAAVEGPQDVSFDELTRKAEQALHIILADPAIASMNTTFNGGAGNTGTMLPNLKPFSERNVNGDQVIARLRPQLAKIPNFVVHMQTRQDVTIGARFSSTQYQYTLQDQDIDELNHWSNVMFAKLKTLPQLVDVATDQQSAGPRTIVNIDRETASRLGILPQQIDDTLYDAFGQRQVATIFTQLNQYYVILEIDPQYQVLPGIAEPDLREVVDRQHGALGRLHLDRAFHLGAVDQPPGPISGGDACRSTRFPGVALGDAVEAVQRAGTDAVMPISVVPTFQGTAQAFQASLVTMPYLIAAALVAVYIVLGILYESFIHPLTILSTIPSAGVGALLMLRAFGYPLDMIGLIGIILLIGIVKKNAIMMIDFALVAERQQNMAPEDAIYHAALLRFRPIMMTTMSAIFSGIPLMLAHGPGFEFRRPLGFAIVGGLILSQALTLFTTPVVYLYLDRLSAKLRGVQKGRPRRRRQRARPSRYR